MIEYKIITYECTNNQCPTLVNAGSTYKYAGSEPPQLRCDACGQASMVKVTDPAKKSIHRHIEQADIDKLKIDLLAEPPQDGETLTQKIKRVDKQIAGMKPITPAQLAEDRKKYEDK